MKPQNLFSDAFPPAQGERFDLLLSHRNLVIERILSSEILSSEEYRQAQDEWVVLLRGEAVLVLASEPVQLAAGDFLFIPAGTPHTVERVSDGAVWLAVHLHAEAANVG